MFNDANIPDVINALNAELYEAGVFGAQVTSLTQQAVVIGFSAHNDMFEEAIAEHADGIESPLFANLDEAVYRGLVEFDTEPVDRSFSFDRGNYTYTRLLKSI